MAWDTARTRRRLEAAATEEFAEHGLDGTTMTRIAERAGLNNGCTATSATSGRCGTRC